MSADAFELNQVEAIEEEELQRSTPCPLLVPVTEILDGLRLEVLLPCALWAGHKARCAAERP